MRKKVYLFYDGECPFCNSYAKMKQLRECIDLELLDANTHNFWKKYDATLDLDDGVIVVVQSTKKILQGVEAIAYLNKVCRFKGIFFALQKFIFSKKFLAEVIYFLLKTLRKIALFLKSYLK